MGGLSLVSGFDIWVPSAREGPLIPLNQLGNSNLCDDLRTNRQCGIDANDLGGTKSAQSPPALLFESVVAVRE